MARKKWTVKSFLLIAAAFLVTAGFLFSGETLAERLLKENPLQQWAEAAPEIKEFALKGETDRPVLYVRLNSTEDLQSVLEPFVREIRKKTKQDITEIIIETPRSEELKEIYYELSFVLEEARNSGSYQELYARLQELEARYKGDFKVFIGEEFIFIQLARGDALYYQAVPRFFPARKVVSS